MMHSLLHPDGLSGPWTQEDILFFLRSIKTSEQLDAFMNERPHCRNVHILFEDPQEEFQIELIGVNNRRYVSTSRPIRKHMSVFVNESLYQSPLSYACRRRHLSVAKQLIDAYGADKNFPAYHDTGGNGHERVTIPPIHYAFMYKNVECLKLLYSVSNRPDIYLIKSIIGLESEDWNHKTRLGIDKWFGEFESSPKESVYDMYSFLLRVDREYVLSTPFSSRNPTWLFHMKEDRLLSLFLYAGVDVNVLNFRGSNALHAMLHSPYIDPNMDMCAYLLFIHPSQKMDPIQYTSPVGIEFYESDIRTEAQLVAAWQRVPKTTETFTVFQMLFYKRLFSVPYQRAFEAVYGVGFSAAALLDCWEKDRLMNMEYGNASLMYIVTQGHTPRPISSLANRSHQDVVRRLYPFLTGTPNISKMLACVYRQRKEEHDYRESRGPLPHTVLQLMNSHVPPGVLQHFFDEEIVQPWRREEDVYLYGSDVEDWEEEDDDEEEEEEEEEEE